MKVLSLEIGGRMLCREYEKRKVILNTKITVIFIPARNEGVAKINTGPCLLVVF